MKITLLIIFIILTTAGTAVACVRAEPTVTVVPSETPISVEPTITPTIELTPTPTAGASASIGDGKGDGLSDGLSSCPDCTKAPVMPTGAPKTGRS